MHGQHSEERQHMWPVPAQCPAIGPVTDTSTCKSISKGGRKFSIGDCALFQAGHAPPFIGILRKVTTDKEGSVRLGVNWLYRPADIKLGKGVSLEAAPNEIFYSFHKDDISAATLLHPCKVSFLRKGSELPPGFVCRRVYDTANKCLWWLTDRDYTDEHQEEVDQLLDRTKLEMQAVVQSGGPSPRSLTGPTSSQQLKSNSEVVQNAAYSAPSKGKKRERSDQNLESSKRERSLKSDDGESSPLKRDRSMRPEEIAAITDKDGGLLNPAGVERLIQLVQQDRNDGVRKAAEVASRRAMLAGVIAATEREDCLSRFVQLGGLPLLDDWLQEAHKGKVGDGGSPKEGDKGVEELLLALLRALDKLPVDLDALKTCIVGKSVNHLRSHKNMEIQKKARKLVDIWKKRVDAEMKLSGEVKSGASHGISWSYKQSSPDLVHPHVTKSASSTEVAVKSSGAFAGNAKAVPSGPNSSEAVKSASLPAGKATSMGTTAGASSLKDSGNLKVGSANVSPDVPGVLVKEEKSSSSGQSQNNGQSWASGQQGKGVVSSTWKEDVKSLVAIPSNSKAVVSVSRHPGLSGKSVTGTLPGGQKEALAGKALVWSRPAAAEKASSSTVSAAAASLDKVAVEGSRDSTNSQHKLLVRIPNPGRSPGRVSGGNYDQGAAASRVMSPNILEKGSGSPDVDSKNRTQNDNYDVTSPGGSSDGRHCGGGGRVGDGSVTEDDKEKLVIPSPAEFPVDSDKRGEELACMVPETISPEGDVPSGNSSTAMILGQVGNTPEVAVEGDNAKCEVSKTVLASSSVDDATPSAGGVDEQGISLLASVAANEISRASLGPTHERLQIDDSNGDHDLGARAASDTGPPQLREISEITHSVKLDIVVDIQTDLPASENVVPGNSSQVKEQGWEERKHDKEGNVSKSVDLESNAEALREERLHKAESKDGEGKFSQEAWWAMDSAGASAGNSISSSDKVGPEKKDDTDLMAVSVSKELACSLREGNAPGGGSGENSCDQDVHAAKLGWKDIPEEKKLQMQGKVGKPGMEFCSSFIGNCVADSKLASAGNCDVVTEDSIKGSESKEGFGRRAVEADVQNLSETNCAFPAEDVLEVAREAASEVEQMERYEKSELDSQDTKSAGLPKGSESREVTFSDQSRDHPWKSHGAGEDKSKDDDASKRGGMHSIESQDTGLGKIEQSSSARSCLPLEVDDVDQARAVNGGSCDRKFTAVVPDGDVTVDFVQDQKKRAGINGQTPAVLGSFRTAPLVTLPSLSALATPHVTKPPPSRTIVAGEPATPEQATETVGLSDGVVGGSDVSERPDFDLNEGFSVEENPHDESISSPGGSLPSASAIISVPSGPSSGLAAPIAVVAATKGPFVLPASPMRIKAELGWKGSAATSAFRPAEPRRTPERQPSAGDSLGLATKKIRPPLDIDLNVADDRGIEDVGVGTVPQGSNFGLSSQVLSSHFNSLSGCSSLSDRCSSPGQSAQASSHTIVRPVLDLNQIDESEESGIPEAKTREHDMSGRLAQAATATSVAGGRVMRDFDLNNGPSNEDGIVDEQQPMSQPPSLRSMGGISAMQGIRMTPDVVNVAPWFGSNNTFAVAIPSFLPVRAEPSYSVAAAAAAQSYFSAGAGAPPFNNDLYRVSAGPSPAPAAVFSSSTPAPYPYTGFPIASGFPFTSAASFGANSSTPYMDSTGSLSFPATSTGVMASTFVRSPYLMGITEMGPPDNSSSSWAVRQNLDLNAGPVEAVDAEGVRDEGVNARQSAMMMGSTGLEQMRVLRQVATSAGGAGVIPLKRKEPEGGWELYRSGGFKQSTWR